MGSAQLVCPSRHHVRRAQAADLSPSAFVRRLRVLPLNSNPRARWPRLVAASTMAIPPTEVEAADFAALNSSPSPDITLMRVTAESLQYESGYLGAESLQYESGYLDGISEETSQAAAYECGDGFGGKKRGRGRGNTLAPSSR